jgi:hypothetical protein
MQGTGIAARSTPAAIPAFAITDKGCVDVEQKKIIDPALSFT